MRARARESIEEVGLYPTVIAEILGEPGEEPMRVITEEEFDQYVKLKRLVEERAIELARLIDLRCPTEPWKTRVSCEAQVTVAWEDEVGDLEHLDLDRSLLFDPLAAEKIYLDKQRQEDALKHSQRRALKEQAEVALRWAQKRLEDFDQEQS